MNLQAVTQISAYASEYGLDHTTNFVMLGGDRQHYIEFSNDLLFSNPSAAIRFVEAMITERQLYNRTLRMIKVA